MQSGTPAGARQTTDSCAHATASVADDDPPVSARHEPDSSPADDASRRSG